MADQYTNEGASANDVPLESSDSIVELNVKTLDSHIYSFQVEKHMPVSSFKEKIANEIGLPVSQQRLIFRGKVLKDEHPLSEYHVENGHTLHLVERQLTPPQPGSGASSGESSSNGANRGNDAEAGAPRGRVGQISHSVVLGTFNVGDQGEGFVPDVSRVIGAVLNSFGIGNQTMAAVAGGGPPTLARQGNEAERNHGNVGGQGQPGIQSQGQIPNPPSQAFPQVVQIPLAAAAVPVPSLSVPLPDSLITLSEFMNRMEQVLSQNGDNVQQQNPTSINTGELPRVSLPSNEQGLRTPEALGVVMRQAQRLLSDHAESALSRVAGRFEQESGSTDPTVRAQLQTESMQLGLAMHHFGALFLELGRTILTLHMGQSPAESFVNAGPAVYISSSGPNPIMVQPFPSQSNSLFGGSALPSNPVTLGPVGIGGAPRHISIHIHAVGNRTSNGEGIQGERRTGGSSSDSTATPSHPVRNVVAAAVPSQTMGVTISNSAQGGQTISISQQPTGSVSSSSGAAAVNFQTGETVGNVRGDDMANSGSEQLNSLGGNTTGECISLPGDKAGDDGRKENASYLKSDSTGSSGWGTEMSEDPVENDQGPSRKHTEAEGVQTAPLGLGLGSLERKRRSRQQTLQVKGSRDGGTSSDSVGSNQQNRMTGQHILQSLASSSSMSCPDARDPNFRRLPSGVNRQMGLNSNGQIDLAGAMAQVLQSPALNSLLSGVSEQTGVGSPDVLRNVLQQFTQSPQMINAATQIAQQVEGQDIESMLGGMGRGQGGGIDLSRMFQQMMPIVSQALGGGGSRQQIPFPVVGADPRIQNERPTSGVEKLNDQNVQFDLQEAAQRMECGDPPENIFRAVAQSSVELSGGNTSAEDIVDDLCSNQTLVDEYMEMLQRDIRGRLEGGLRGDRGRS